MFNMKKKTHSSFKILFILDNNFIFLPLLEAWSLSHLHWISSRKYSVQVYPLSIEKGVFRDDLLNDLFLSTFFSLEFENIEELFWDVLFVIELSFLIWTCLNHPQFEEKTAFFFILNALFLWQNLFTMMQWIYIFSHVLLLF